jgi:hypothetical protein
LAAAGIKVGQDLEGLTIQTVIDRFKSGAIVAAQAANKAGR